MDSLLGHLLSPRSNDCPSGYSFYRCQANGFAGCCSVDACNYRNGCPAIYYYVVPDDAETGSAASQSVAASTIPMVTTTAAQLSTRLATSTSEETSTSTTNKSPSTRAVITSIVSVPGSSLAPIIITITPDASDLSAPTATVDSQPAASSDSVAAPDRSPSKGVIGGIIGGILGLILLVLLVVGIVFYRRKMTRRAKHRSSYFESEPNMLIMDEKRENKDAAGFYKPPSPRTDTDPKSTKRFSYLANKPVPTSPPTPEYRAHQLEPISTPTIPTSILNPNSSTVHFSPDSFPSPLGDRLSELPGSGPLAEADSTPARSTPSTMRVSSMVMPASLTAGRVHDPQQRHSHVMSWSNYDNEPSDQRVSPVLTSGLSGGMSSGSFVRVNDSPPSERGQGGLNASAWTQISRSQLP